MSDRPLHDDAELSLVREQEAAIDRALFKARLLHDEASWKALNDLLPVKTEDVIECIADEYEALARQMHESIAEGQTIAETATALRILAAPDRRELFEAGRATGTVEGWADYTPAQPVPLTLDALRPALAEWDAIEGSGLADQFRAFIAAGKMADAIRAALLAVIARADDFLNKRGDMIAAHITLYEALHPEEFAASPDKG